MKGGSHKKTSDRISTVKFICYKNFKKKKKQEMASKFERIQRIFEKKLKQLEKLPEDDPFWNELNKKSYSMTTDEIIMYIASKIDQIPNTKKEERNLKMSRLKTTNWNDWNKEQKQAYEQKLAENYNELQYPNVVVDDEQVEKFRSLVDELDKDGSLQDEVNEKYNIMNGDEVNDYIVNKINEASKNGDDIRTTIFNMGLTNLEVFDDSDINHNCLQMDDAGHFQVIKQQDLKDMYEDVLSSDAIFNEVEEGIEAC